MGEGQRPFPIVITGHVDHGKSTLIGRLLYDTGSLQDERYQEMRESSAAVGRPDEFAFVLDAFEEERRRGITIDTSQIFFRSPARPYVIIDAPGHREFIRNMVTGASYAEAAVLIVDAQEGIRAQTRRHAWLLNLVGIRDICVVINKLDLVAYGGERYRSLSQEINTLFGQFGLNPYAVVPISALQGENVASRSAAMSWYEGPCLLEVLDGLERKPFEERPFRFPVQDVYTDGGQRVIVGRIEAGSISLGTPVHLLPGGEVIQVAEILKYPQKNVRQASYGESIGLLLAAGAAEGIARGTVLAGGEQPRIGSEFNANLFWFRGTYHAHEPLSLRCVTQEVPVRIALDRTYDPAELGAGERPADRLEVGEIANCTIYAERPLVVDYGALVPEMGRFVIERAGLPAGGGIII
jgi:sulfate adenylyltransferase subunit 1